MPRNGSSAPRKRPRADVGDRRIARDHAVHLLVVIVVIVHRDRFATCAPRSPDGAAGAARTHAGQSDPVDHRSGRARRVGRLGAAARRAAVASPAAAARSAAAARRGAGELHDLAKPTRSASPTRSAQAERKTSGEIYCVIAQRPATTGWCRSPGRRYRAAGAAAADLSHALAGAR